ncbi:MAG: hypothetical protein IPL38_13055 [Rhodobacter sp.]|nr:hypothetical protein [Rhodobacter sp.]MBK8440366.1 hypothetical protein [Rhodobacter sp.]
MTLLTVTENGLQPVLPEGVEPMMICDADFDELFPSTARIKRPVVIAERQALPDAVSLARWEDDGGRTRIGRRVAFLDGRGIVTICTRPEKGGFVRETQP